MWQLEQVPTSSQHSHEEESVLQQFQQTVQVQDDGRYSVSLSKIANPPTIGKTLKMATSRFLGNEREEEGQASGIQC